MSARAEPFPFAALPAISRAEIRAGARLREAAAAFVGADAVAASLAEMSGESVAISVRRARPHEPAGAPAGGVAVALGAAGASTLEGAVLVELEAALCAALVSRALRQRAPRILDTSRGPSPEVAGAVAALVHAAIRRAHAGAPMRVVAAGPAPMLARDFAAANGVSLCAWLTVRVGDEAFDARVNVPEPTLPPERTIAGLSRDALAAMGEAPLALPLVVATCLSDRGTLGSLRAGDAFVLPEADLRVARGWLTGRVTLVAASSERGLAADLGEDGRLVLRSGPLETHPWDRPIGDAMTGESNATLEVLEDAPVVVRVELGTVELKAREWASLAPGDVVALGRKLGDPAILRVGGVEVARGELVQVDGEYGVRILPRGAGGRG